jgi:hypothetical protein
MHIGARNASLEGPDGRDNPQESAASRGQAVRDKARKERLSLSRAVERLLEEATGTSKGTERVVHHDLDRFFGTWTKREADSFDESLREQRQIEPKMWK